MRQRGRQRRGARQDPPLPGRPGRAHRDTLIAAGGVAAAVAAGIALALAGSDGSVEAGHVPVFAAAVAVAYALNWAVFVPSALARTERCYDLTGATTFLTVTGLAVALSRDLDARAAIVTALVGVWAVRLGSFLSLRIRRDGRDRRFDRIKADRLAFGAAWTVQALWVVATAGPALAVITATERSSLGAWAGLGVAVWTVGFGLEVVADEQKRRFRGDPANHDAFITTGAWAWSRHPNYLGEIVLWTGVALVAVPVLAGWRWLLLVSPVFVWLLLTRLSGIPLLERHAEERWGDDPAYRRYVATTPRLVPRPDRWRAGATDTVSRPGAGSTGSRRTARSPRDRARARSRTS